MKKTIVAGALAVSLFAAGIVAANFEHKRENRLERMAENLNLTADQQTKIRAIFDEKHSKMKALHEESHKKVLAVLTPEQKEKFEKQREERKKRD